MIYFNRHIGGNASVIPHGILDQNEKEMFDVSSRVSSDKENAFKASLRENPTLYADHAAAVFASLYRANFIREDVIAPMLELCARTVETRGFTPMTFQDLPIHDTSKHCVVVVCGCNNYDVLRRRVRAAVDFSVAVKRSFQLVFSGKCSSTPPISVPDEASAMQVLYSRMMSQKAVDPGHVTIRPAIPERNATKTSENIDFVLSDKGLFNFHNKYSLVVISSTFHLIRIAQILQNYIADDKHAMSSFIDDISLIGAEVPADDSSNVRQDWPSIKALIFELYWAHMK